MQRPTRAEAHAFREAWRRFAAWERRSRAGDNRPADRLRILGDLMASARFFPSEKGRERGVAVVRRRWAGLRRTHDA